MKKSIYFLIILVVFMLYSCDGILDLPEFAPFSFETAIKPIHSNRNDHFGYSVNIDSETVIIGVQESDIAGENSGVAYIYEKNNYGSWLPTAQLFSSDIISHDYFGCAVDISGDYAVVGARGVDNPVYYAGAAYIFERDINGTWYEKAILRASDAAETDFFGCAVAIDGNYAIIGANGKAITGNQDGAAYIFERDSAGNWNEVAILHSSDIASFAFFGNSVSIDGKFAIIGAPMKNTINGIDNGAAYLFECDNDGNWYERAILYASDAGDLDRFGSSVSINDKYIIIGAPMEDSNGWKSGAAYIFEKKKNNSWIETTILHASDAEAEDLFGFSVSLSGNCAVVGAQGKDVNGIDNGAAYVFNCDTSGNWNKLTTLYCQDLCDTEQFGLSVAISKNCIVAGAPNFFQTGAAYIYESYYKN